MKQLLSNKSSIAWFQLAEFVARGEKERALSIYRLLFHSIKNEAVRVQLEGDILYAFNDKAAVQSYFKAAALHQQDNDLIQAINLYERALALLIKSEGFTQAHDLLRDLELGVAEKALLHDQLVIGMLNADEIQNQTLLTMHMNWALDGYMASSHQNGRAITNFLAKLAALNDVVHQAACEYISVK